MCLSGKQLSSWASPKSPHLPSVRDLVCLMRRVVVRRGPNVRDTLDRADSDKDRFLLVTEDPLVDDGLQMVGISSVRETVSRHSGWTWFVLFERGLDLSGSLSEDRTTLTRRDGRLSVELLCTESMGEMNLCFFLLALPDGSEGSTIVGWLRLLRAACKRTTFLCLVSVVWDLTHDADATVLVSVTSVDVCITSYTAASSISLVLELRMELLCLESGASFGGAGTDCSANRSGEPREERLAGHGVILGWDCDESPFSDGLECPSGVLLGGCGNASVEWVEHMDSEDD